MRDGLPTYQFVRYQLMRLGLDDDLQSIQCGGYNHPITSVEEVLALRPELESSN